MIDINELREAIQTFGSQAIDEGDLNEILDRLEAAEKERDALCAKIEQMEKQEPVAFLDADGAPILKRHLAPWADLYALPGAQPAPSIPDGWLRVIDEALVVTHLGVADESDTYEQAREKLTNLIGWHVDVATDPAVNGGWKLVPIEPTKEMRDAWDSSPICEDDDAEFRRAYSEMLAAAPEVKP